MLKLSAAADLSLQNSFLLCSENKIVLENYILKLPPSSLVEVEAAQFKNTQAHPGQVTCHKAKNHIKLKTEK